MQMAVCGLAIAAGVLGVVALAKAIRWSVFRRRFGYGHGPWAMGPTSCGAGFGGGACGGHGYRGWHGGDEPWEHRRGWRGGPGGTFWLRALFSRLDTTPGQEREIRAAIEEVQLAASEGKSDLKTAREDLAKAIRGESFDDAAIGEASVRADVGAAKVKDALTNALRRVHAVLDTRQRERLADLLANGPSFGRGRWGGPYRDAL
jgi:Spy/CpxP family protein refolding chaperone